VSKEVSTELAEMNEYKNLAIELAKSDLIPQSFKKPQDAWYAILYGRDLGLTPIYSLNNISVINGKPGLSADAMLAICRRSPEYGGFTVDVETDQECRVTLRRLFANGVSEIREVSFSIAEAKQAGLLDGKSQMYRKYPKRMLRARATAFACRDLFSDLLAGSYSQEELAFIRPDTKGGIETPEYEVIDDAAPKAIERAVKECQDVMRGFSMTSTKKAEFDSRINVAKGAGDVSALEDIAVELETIKQKQIAAAAKKHEPDPELALKEQIVTALNALGKTGKYEPKHMANSFRKQINVSFEGDDWKEALLKADIPVADMKKALKYWEERLASLAPAKEKTLREQAHEIVNAIHGDDDAIASLEEADKLDEAGDTNGYAFIIDRWGAK
jgi:hypothetical protein